MTDELSAARALLPGVRLDRTATLRAGERASVHRVRADWPDGRPRSLIVKQFRGAGEGWVREAAALSVLSGSQQAPQLVAEGADPPIVITADLGTGPSVADALLGNDPEAADRAVIEWAQSLAALHAATRDARPAFRSALAARQGELPVAESRLAADLDDAVRAIDRACATLDVRAPADALEQLRGLAKRLGGSGAAALTPADACPDNNLATPTGRVLIDFDDAQWRHVAWDVAYLRVPWPTCWCSWRMPDGLAERAVAAYRVAAGEAFPQVAGHAFERDVDAAVLGWALLTTTLFLDNALGADPQPRHDRPTPTRRAILLHRLDRASRSPELPALAELAGRLCAELRRRWGDVPLRYAQAFAAAQ